MPTTPEDSLDHRVRSAKSGRDLIRALESYYTAAEAHAATFLAAGPKPLACHDGCSQCCCIPVEARAQELLLLAEHIRQHYSEAAFDALIERLRTHVSIVTRLTTQQQLTTNMICPLLLDGRCSAYEARPLACRRHHSLDIAVCRKVFEDPSDITTDTPKNQELFSAWTKMATAVITIFAEAEYDPVAYELGSGLLEALTNSAAGRRFQQKKKAFPGARVLR